MDPYKNIKSELRENLIYKNKSFLQDKLFMEFGVNAGTSLLEFYDFYTKHGIKKNFFGFDSFVGLPEEKFDVNSPWKTGKFSCDGKINPELLNKNDISIYNGWFSETLVYNADLYNKTHNKKVGIAHIDCDIYTSTLQVLDFLLTNNLLCDGSLLIYDDWGSFLMNGMNEYENGQSKAHIDIENRYNIKFKHVEKIVVDPQFYIINIFKV